MHEVIPHLWVGGGIDVIQARIGGMIIIGVRHIRDDGDDEWIPCIKPVAEAVDRASEVIRRYLMEGNRVLVHCAVGKERAPLTVTWYLHRFGGYATLEEAFAAVKAKRPQAEHRLAWLEPDAELPRDLLGETVEG